jgi:tRNA modification GTPase
LTLWSRSIPAKIFRWSHGRGYTGEESIEIHTIGSPVILDAIIATLCEVPGVRLAKPGEFTLRAFLAGRLDLTQAEAVLGVIDAANDTDLKTALGQLAGNVATPLKETREQLFDLLTQLEAGLDFAEEEIEFINKSELHRIITDSLEQVEALRQRIERRGLPNEKPKIVLTGEPNVGKSTLFNLLLHRNQAIVSPFAGTTRDYLEAETTFGSVPCLLIDTAGVNELRDEIVDHGIGEQAQNIARKMYNQADILLDCGSYRKQGIVRVCSTQRNGGTEKVVPVSVSPGKTKLAELKRVIGEMLKANVRDDDLLPNTALRCKDAVFSASESLHRALQTLQTEDESLMALEIRAAVNSLGIIDGSVHTEDILDRIFSRFCIGK